MDWNGSEWIGMDRNGSEWIGMDGNGSEWMGMDRNAEQLFPPCATALLWHLGVSQAKVNQDNHPLSASVIFNAISDSQQFSNMEETFLFIHSFFP
jgi:hypothetical protein